MRIAGPAAAGPRQRSDLCHPALSQQKESSQRASYVYVFVCSWDAVVDVGRVRTGLLVSSTASSSRPAIQDEKFARSWARGAGQPAAPPIAASASAIASFFNPFLGRAREDDALAPTWSNRVPANMHACAALNFGRASREESAPRRRTVTKGVAYCPVHTGQVLL